MKPAVAIPTAIETVTEVLSTGRAMTLDELQGRTGLKIVTLRQALLKMRDAGIAVSEPAGIRGRGRMRLRVHRLLTEEERAAVVEAQRCVLAEVWTGVRAAA